ncbi:MAG: glycerate kinase [Thermaerobacterales bacterium]
MEILVCPTAFKGSLNPAAAAKAIADGLQRAWPGAVVRSMPIADGGDGLLSVLQTARGGTLLCESVCGPLPDQPVTARFLLLDDTPVKTAVIEAAAASGLALIQGSENPWLASSYGTGQLILAALERGARKILVGMGGSATNDAGTGLLAALGVRFVDGAGQPLTPNGGALGNIARVDWSGLDRLALEAEFIGLADVQNPLLGPEGATFIFGRQKGADHAMLQRLEAGMREAALIMAAGAPGPAKVGRAQAASGAPAPWDIPGAGAAGGIGFALHIGLGADLRPGIEAVLDMLEMDRYLQTADLVIVGEGKLDLQTSLGKAPAGLSARARRYGVPVVALVGAIDGDLADPESSLGLLAVLPIVSGPMTTAAAVAQGAALLEAAAFRLGRLLAFGAGEHGSQV